MTYGLTLRGDLENITGQSFFRIDSGGNPVANPLPKIAHNGRVMLRESATHNLAVDGQVTGGSWVQTAAGGGLDYYEDNASLALAASFGIGISAAVRTFGGSPSGAHDAIAFAGLARHDQNNIVADAWVAYFDAQKAVAGAGDTKTLEVQIANLPGPSPQSGMDPYKSFVQGKTIGVSIAAGSDAAVHGPSYAVDAALQIANNGALFHTGLNFRFNALKREGQADTAGASGNHDSYARAIGLAHFHGLSWWSRDLDPAFDPDGDGTGNRREVFRLFCRVNDPAKTSRLQFSDDGMIYASTIPGGADATDDPMFAVDLVGGGDNYLAVRAAALGSPPALLARGNSDNINVRLVPKGTGLVQLGYDHTAAATPANFSAVRSVPLQMDNGTVWVPAMTTPW